MDGEIAYQNLILENRKKLTLTGVNDMLSYSEEQVELSTEMGNLTVRGEGMKIETYNTTSKDTVILGNIYALVYTNDNFKKENLFKKVIGAQDDTLTYIT